MRPALVLALALAAPSAFADVVGPPPGSCPNGSTPESNHAGPYCAPNACGDGGATCATGATCQLVPLCLATRTANSHGTEFPYVDVTGSCASGGCASGTCTSLQVCASPSSPSSPTSGCSCASASGGAGGLAVSLAAMLLGLARRRAA
jgi:MYXO-CTERM domain-containing protein